MEVKETAACGISLREFALEFEPEELSDIYRVLIYAQNGEGFYDEDFLEELKSQMIYIIGPSLEEELSEEDIAEERAHWEDTGASYNLKLNEEEAKKFFKILLAVEHPGEWLNEEFRKKLADQMIEMAPTLLENLPIINR